MKACIVQLFSVQPFCSDTSLLLWTEDPNKTTVVFLSSRIIVVFELLGAPISQQKIEK